MAFKPKILVVNDAAAERRELEATLRGLGVAVFGFGKSREASGLINKRKFDAVILAWTLSNPSGLELARAVRSSKSNAHVPIVLLGTVEAADLKACFAAGVQLFLPRPLKPEHVQTMFRALYGLMGEEDRRYRRVPFDANVTCSIAEQHITARALNLSAGGLFLALLPAPPLKTRLTVTFILPGSPLRYTLPAQVVYSLPGQGAGLQFTRLDKDERAALRAFLDQSTAA